MSEKEARAIVDKYGGLLELEQQGTNSEIEAVFSWIGSESNRLQRQLVGLD